MTASTDHPVMSQAEAVALGFAGFNDVPHKPIDVPDGEYTITARTSDGRRVTFCFLPDRERSPAGFVDIQYHDAGTKCANANGGHSPTFNAFGIGRGGRHILDSRPLDEADRPSILVLMLDKAEPKSSPRAKARDAGGRREVSWSFGEGTIFPGYTDDREWNGFLDISVAEHTWPHVRAELLSSADGDRELIASVNALKAEAGFVSLAFGYTTQEVETRWSLQFPDYPIASMPPIPGDWTDKSWRKDTKPSFEVCTGPMGEPVEMWIDYPVPALREIASEPRFGLYRRNGDDELEAIYTGEDYAEAMEHANRETLACAFANALADQMTPEEWQTMRLTNQTITPGCCASHDHLDANMVMLAVWLTYRGDQLIARGAITDIGDDLDHVNAAWTIARERYMTASPEGERFDLWRCTGVTVPDLAAPGCEMGDNEPCIRPGRLYEPGHIELDDEKGLIVTVGNSIRTFEHQIEAEGYLWRAYASSEFTTQPGGVT